MATATRTTVAANLAEAARAAANNAKGHREALANAAAGRDASDLLGYAGSVAFYDAQVEYLSRIAEQLGDNMLPVASLISDEQPLPSGDLARDGKRYAIRIANEQLRRIADHPAAASDAEYL